MLRGVEPKVILDVGAGSGFFAAEMLARGGAVEATCVDPAYQREFDEERSGKPLRFRTSCDSLAADCVLLLDVLEHVRDDRGFLRDYVARVPRGAHFLVTVPAFSLLWSDHDVFLGHYRRYRLSNLEDVVSSAGLRVVRDAYYFGLVFPVALARRLARGATPGTVVLRSDLRRHHPVVNRLLAAVCRAELPLLAFNRVAGLSALCLARKE